MAASVQLCLSGPRTPEGSLADHLHAASEADFSALDIWAPKLNDYLAIYPVVWLDIEMQKHGVYAASVSGIELLPVSSREEDLVHEADFLELCTRLDALGGGTIVFWPGAHQESAEAGTQSTSQMVRVLRRYSDLAALFEVRIALESPGSTTSAAHTLAASQEVVHQVARANVGLALNIGQLRESGSGPEDIGTLAVNKLWLVRLETAPPQFRPTRMGTEAGREVAPSPVVACTGEGWRGGLVSTTLQQALCERLAARGFCGPYCVEWPAPASTGQQDERQNTLIERIRQSHQAALELLTPFYS